MLKKALKDAFEWSAKWYLGSFSTAIATFLFFRKEFEFEILRSFRYGIAVMFLTFVIRLIIQYIKEIENLSNAVNKKQETIELLDTKKNRQKILTANNIFGDAILTLKDLFAEFHYLRKGDAFESTEMIKVFSRLCDELKLFFEKRVNNEYVYSVCIKIVLFDENHKSDISQNAEVITLCRDERSQKKRDLKTKIKHSIFDNTCFSEIFYKMDQPEKFYYLNNDLPDDKYYKNTSFQIYGSLPDNLTSEERKNQWTLPYKSEVVVPISPIKLERDLRKKEFLGYICVDCDHTFGFHSKYDAGMLHGIADGIFDMIKAWQRNKINLGQS